jgi:hypothetical protein
VMPIEWCDCSIRGGTHGRGTSCGRGSASGASASQAAPLRGCWNSTPRSELNCAKACECLACSDSRISPLRRSGESLLSAPAMVARQQKGWTTALPGFPRISIRTESNQKSWKKRGCHPAESGRKSPFNYPDTKPISSSP